MLFAIIITLLDKLGSIFFRRENQLAREVRQHQLLAPRRSFPVIPVVRVLFMVSAVTIAAVFVSLGSAAGDTDLSVVSQLPIPIIESSLIPTAVPPPRPYGRANLGPDRHSYAHGHAGADTYPDTDGYSGPHTYAQTHGSATTNPGPDPHANSGSRSVRQ